MGPAGCFRWPQVSSSQESSGRSFQRGGRVHVCQTGPWAGDPPAARRGLLRPSLSRRFWSRGYPVFLRSSRDWEVGKAAGWQGWLCGAGMGPGKACSNPSSRAGGAAHGAWVVCLFTLGGASEAVFWPSGKGSGLASGGQRFKPQAPQGRGNGDFEIAPAA